MPRWVSGVLPHGEAGGEPSAALRPPPASPSPSRGGRREGRPSRENAASAGESPKRQQPKHTADPGQPRLPAQLLVRLPRSQMPLLEKISSWLGTPWPACLPCEGRRGCRVWAAQHPSTAVPLKPGQEQGGRGRGGCKQNIFAKNILVQEKIFFLFFPYSCWKTKVLLKQHQNISC